MAYNKDVLEELSLKAIKSHGLVFVDDLRGYLPCDISTFYNHKLDKLETIKGALAKNRIDRKIELREKWYNSEAPALQMGLYKLISEKSEYNRLSNQPIQDEKESVSETLPLTLANGATSQYLKTVLAINKNKIVIQRGGTRSSKSYSNSQMAVDWLLTGKIGQLAFDDSFNIVMATLPFLKATIVHDLDEIISERNLEDKIKHHKTENYFEFEKRRINYFSSDKTDKMKRKSGFTWMDEADMMTYEAFQQIISRVTTGKCLISFNPSNPDIWINQKLEIERQLKKGDVKVLKSSYLDNPFLDEAQIEEIEYLMTVDPEYKQVYGKGEYGNLSGLVYPLWELFDNLPEERDYLEIIGLDYGFVNDPMAISRIFIDRHNREVFIYELMYSTGMTQDDVDEVLNPYLGLPIIIDGAAQETFNSLANSGHAVEKAKKGAGSIVGGISLVRKYKINLHREAKGAINENKKYSYAKDKKTGLKTEHPIDKDNHAMDEIRYVITWYDNLYGWEQKGK